jgi:DNA-directed RNA polymerase subunit RPC12/RpoP
MYECFRCKTELDTNKDIYPMDFDNNAWCTNCWKENNNPNIRLISSRRIREAMKDES